MSETKSNESQQADSKSFTINNYYGRFTLEEIDNEIDVIKLQKVLAEVNLDFQNNRVTFAQHGSLKTKKHMNFCRFMIARIEQRISEIKRIQNISRDIINYKRASPDRWKLIVSIIVERYPGIDMQHIVDLIDGEN